MDIKHFNLTACNRLLQLRRERRISWRAFGLGLVITSFAEKGTGEAWPSRSTLKAISGIDMRDISRTTSELEKVGFFAVDERDGRSNIYRLTLGDLATGGELPPLGKQPPTLGDLAAKPLGKQPPITMKEQYRNNDLPQNNEKPPSSSAPAANSQDDYSESKPKGKSSPQGNQTPPPAPAPAKVTWDGRCIIVPGAFMESWAEAYPTVDLHLAIKRASVWCLSNPGKRPKKDFARFLNGWFRRVTPSSPEYIDPKEQADDDADLIRQAKKEFPDPDEMADFFYQRQKRGLRVPPGVDCRPMPAEKEVAV